MTKTGVVRPWSDVAWDLARAAGVDPDAVADELERLTDDDWDREAALLEQLNTGLATKLWQDLLNGAVIARDASGKPLPRLPQENAYTGPNKPFVWVDANLPIQRVCFWRDGRSWPVPVGSVLVRC